MTCLASVIGDYIYFDGGEVFQLGNRGRTRRGSGKPFLTMFEKPSSANPFTSIANSTLSIDLSTSWTSEGVQIREVPKPSAMIHMVKQAIFTDESTGRFFIWGGHTTVDYSIGDPILWYFTPDGNGGGNWTVGDPSTGSSITSRDSERAESSAYSNANGAGFAFGGLSTRATSLEPRGNLVGYAVFNFTTREWTRESNGPYSSDGTLYGATATFAPIFGSNGLIFVLGGQSGFRDYDQEYVTFQRVHFLDPATREWQFQVTTGEAPSGRFYHCSVGVASTSGTFEIFVFGGSNSNERTEYSDLYVLSLPGFRWTRVSGLNTSARAEHVCAVVGKRQFISWGGLNATYETSIYDSPDSFPQGIGIFDMTALEWRDEYNPSTEPYRLHLSIQAWYDQSGPDTVNWSSDEVRQLFLSEALDDGGNSSGDDNQPTGDQPPGNQSDPGLSSGDIASIVGGVIGAVIGTALIQLGIWFYCRRRKATRQIAAPQPEPESKSNAKVVPGVPQELASMPEPRELHDQPVIAEFRGDEGSMGR
ncbi:hypothetical protein S40293_02131 [Stachybotrys chartarum IBT 40293]|nr:hypothetical protein S40293_02131 [Stachybotrys chartarum IBT 40293]